MSQETEITAAEEAIARVVTERRRQVEKEGWTPERDDVYTTGELAMAASCYAANIAKPGRMAGDGAESVPDLWPWQQAWWKPSPDDRLRDLEKAGALILAEMERLIRAGGSNGIK